MKTRKNKKLLVKGGIGGGNAEIRWNNLQFIISLFGDKVETILEGEGNNYETEIEKYIDIRKKEEEEEEAKSNKKSSFKWLSPKKFGFKGKSVRDDKNPIYKLVQQIFQSRDILDLMLQAFIIIKDDINNSQITTRFYIDLKDLEKILPDDEVLKKIFKEKLFLPGRELTKEEKKIIDNYYDKLKFNVHESVKKRIKQIFYYRALLYYLKSSDNEDEFTRFVKEQKSSLESILLNNKVISENLLENYNEIMNNLFELLKVIIKNKSVDVETSLYNSDFGAADPVVDISDNTEGLNVEGLNVEGLNVEGLNVEGGTTKRKRKQKRKRTKKTKNKYK